MKVEAFFDKKTFTVAYIVYDETSKDAVLIDPVWDYNPVTGETSLESMGEYTKFIKDSNLELHYVVETHAHADHLSSSQKLKEIYPSLKIAIGENVKKVQKTFKDVFNLDDSFLTDASQFDTLLKENELLNAGTLTFKILNTKGHTPACVSLYIEDYVFVGDAIFMPDFGTGRCDFPLGSAEDMYDSIFNKLYSLPDDTKVYVGHDYMPNGRSLEYMTTIKEEKEKNIQINTLKTKDDFIKFRNERDKSLAAPGLIYQSVQVNINAGITPVKGKNGASFLKIPFS